MCHTTHALLLSCERVFDKANAGEGHLETRLNGFFMWSSAWGVGGGRVREEK